MTEQPAVPPLDLEAPQPDLDAIEAAIRSESLVDFVRLGEKSREWLTQLIRALRDARQRVTELETQHSWNSYQKHHENAKAATRRLGFEEGALQWLWRSPECFTRKYDQQEVITAICDALTREGCTAWSGDGTSCVEQMVRLQWDRAAQAEAALAAAVEREQVTEERIAAMVTAATPVFQQVSRNHLLSDYEKTSNIIRVALSPTPPEAP